ncbi:MAG TPA: hypothetical protein VNR86_02220, partial [Sphingomicrobium sp.]|nr:hypothetical protein [Sphingomicrobium sp.]
RKINRLLNHEGYTVRGVQKLLRDRTLEDSEPSSAMPSALPPAAAPALAEASDRGSGVDVFRLIALRNRLLAALEP